MTSTAPLHARLADRMDAVLETEEAQALLENNSLQQHVIIVTDTETVSIHIEPHTADLTVEDGPDDPDAVYELFETTIITTEHAVAEALVDGSLLSEQYLEGHLDLRGIPPIWSVLGPLFRINAELLGAT